MNKVEINKILSQLGNRSIDDWVDSNIDLILEDLLPEFTEWEGWIGRGLVKRTRFGTYADKGGYFAFPLSNHVRFECMFGLTESEALETLKLTLTS